LLKIFVSKKQQNRRPNRRILLAMSQQVQNKAAKGF
jgi:hypothetical protein